MEKDKEFEKEFLDKICFLGNLGDKVDVDHIKRLVRHNRYVCSACGRSASEAENLCSPEIL